MGSGETVSTGIEPAIEILRSRLGEVQREQIELWGGDPDQPFQEQAQRHEDYWTSDPGPEAFEADAYLSGKIEAFDQAIRLLLTTLDSC